VSDPAGGGRGVYSIGAVARMLEIPVATIRNWEERYATIVPERSPGGHRLYSRDDVERLRFIAAEVARGLSAADAHRLLAERSGAGGVARGDLIASTRLLVLVAERDRAAADLQQFFLRIEGYDVQLAFGAEEAEERWREDRPDLAIVELMISGGQGTELCRRLKEQQDARAVLAISALEGRDDALAAGADAFLQKPFDPLELVSTVKDLLGASALVARRTRDRGTPDG
jgi:CheY-like chemotaxis protein